MKHILLLTVLTWLFTISGCCGGGSGVGTGNLRFVPQFDACLDRYEVTVAIGTGTPHLLEIDRGSGTKMVSARTNQQVRIVARGFLGQVETAFSEQTVMTRRNETTDILLPRGACQ